MKENENALIAAATQIVVAAFSAPLEQRQALGDVLIAAQKFLERQFKDKGGA